MQGAEVATPADRKARLGQRLPMRMTPALSHKCGVSHASLHEEERGGVAARERQTGRRLQFIGSRPI